MTAGIPRTRILVSLMIVTAILCSPGVGTEANSQGSREPRGYLTSLPELARVKEQADKKVEPYASAVSATINFAEDHLKAEHRYEVPRSYNFNHNETERPDWMAEMGRAAYGLTLAFRLTGKEAYALKARDYIHDIQKCKNLNEAYLRYAMCYVCIHIPKFIHAADLLEGWDGWAATDRRDLQDWACQVTYPICRRSLKENTGGNHAWAASAVMAIADYCWDRPALLFKSEDANDRIYFDAEQAYAHARQELLNQINGNNNAAASQNADNFVFGQGCVLKKAMIRPDGGLPDGLFKNEKSGATVIKNVANGSNYTVVWTMSTLEAYLFASELALRRGDPSLYANIRTTSEFHYVADTGATLTLPPGRGSIRQVLSFLVTNEERGGPALNLNDYHRGLLEIYLRRYKDWSLPTFVDWRIVDGQVAGGRFEERPLEKTNVDRITAILGTMRPIADAWVPFATLTHADPLGVIGEPRIVAPPGGEITTPAAPEYLTATPNDGLICLSWIAPPGATEYSIKRSTQPGTGYVTIATGLGSSRYTDGKLTNGTSYYYVVVPWRGRTEGAPSVEVSATPRLQAPQPMIGTNQITAGSSWKYYQEAKEPGPGWKDKVFVETNWTNVKAPLGFGTPAIATAIPADRKTYYIRKLFSVQAEPTNFLRHTLTVSYAGGFILYLNGEEILRRGLPAGPVTYDTPATSSGAMTTEEIDISAALNKVYRGVAILAVEVHLAQANKNALAWEAKLVSERPAALITHPEGG